MSWAVERSSLNCICRKPRQQNQPDKSPRPSLLKWSTTCDTDLLSMTPTYCIWGMENHDHSESCSLGSHFLTHALIAATLIACVHTDNNNGDLIAKTKCLPLEGRGVARLSGHPFTCMVPSLPSPQTQTMTSYLSLFTQSL